MRRTLGNLPTNLAACSCPPALPPAWLAPRLRPCLELVSGSRLLQHIRPEPATSYRLSILWPPSRLGSDSRPSVHAFRPEPFPWPFGLTLRWSPLGRSRGLRSPAEVRSRLAPFASAQPSCRLPVPALDVGLAPFVSGHSFRPAFWPASLRCFGSRLRAFVLKRPSGMPLALRRRLLQACGFVWPSCWLLPQPSGNRPEACASADCSGLAAFTSCGCQLPQGLWTTGLSIRKNLRSSESALSPAPACVRLAPRAALKPAS